MVTISLYFRLLSIQENLGLRKEIHTTTCDSLGIYQRILHAMDNQSWHLERFGLITANLPLQFSISVLFHFRTSNQASLSPENYCSFNQSLPPWCFRKIALFFYLM
jgi:hypothetical protein